MKPEALDAMVNETMRPQALEAATTQDHEQGLQHGKAHLRPNEQSQHSNNATPTINEPKLGTPFGERTEGIESAAKLVGDVAHGVKVAVDGALAWAEKKADKLSSEQDSVGPYTSHATRVPSDLDPIADGDLPAIVTKPSGGEEAEKESSQGRKEGGNGGTEPKL